MKPASVFAVATKIVAIAAFALAAHLALPAFAEPLALSEGAEVGTHRVDVNSASFEELVTLPGIGPAIAQRIIEARQARPFRRPQELMRVNGIGRAKMLRLLPYVSTDAPPPTRS
jgi:DNA uptake protein ComE-like DNA-binding protein